MESLEEPALCGPAAVSPVLRCTWLPPSGPVALRTWRDEGRSMIVATARVDGRVRRVARTVPHAALDALFALVERRRRDVAPSPAEEQPVVAIPDLRFDGARVIEEASTPARGFEVQLADSAPETCQRLQQWMAARLGRDVVRLAIFGADLRSAMHESSK
ncbi:MAG: hypothetical protein U0235_09655 [Polyangiaceae bacterium]